MAFRLDEIVNRFLVRINPAARTDRSAAVVKSWAAELESDCRHGVAAMCVIVPRNATLKKHAFAYHTNLAKEANLVKAPENGVLKLTALVNVSGHTGEVEQFATDPNQTFNVSVTDPSGKTQTYNIKRDKPTGAQYVATIDLEIPVTQKGTYIISGWPQGSGGAAGYIEGRQYNLHVGKENFFDPNSVGEVAYSER